MRGAERGRAGTSWFQLVLTLGWCLYSGFYITHVAFHHRLPLDISWLPLAPATSNRKCLIVNNRHALLLKSEKGNMLLAKCYRLWERVCHPSQPYSGGILVTVEVMTMGRMSPPMCLRSPKENTHPFSGFCCLIPPILVILF